MKRIKAVTPFFHNVSINFKIAPYNAWVLVGGEISKSHYPPCCLKGIFYNHDFPTLFENETEVRLRFVEPLSLYFDTFPDYIYYEVIPFVWDCWPFLFEKMAKWMERHNVKTAIFTCAETARLMKERFPQFNIMHCPEGIDSSSYKKGKQLKDRKYNLFEFGRPLFKYVNIDHVKYDNLCDNVKYLRTGSLKKRLSDEELYEVMSDSQVTICYPHCITEPEWCDGLETLTQRYWECMLSRNVIVGHSPQELIDFIGYNPVIEAGFNDDDLSQTVKYVIDHIEKYQELVDKNRETAERLSDWKLRMENVMQFLEDCGYNCR